MGDPRRRMTALRALPLALCLGLVAPAAHAQATGADLAAARELGIQGVKLANAGDCRGAIDFLSRSEQLHHAPSTLEKLGECQIKVGKLVDGSETLRRVVREVLAADAPAPFVSAQERATQLLGETKPRIAQLKINVTAPANADFKVKLDGELLPTAILNVNRPTDPGEHTLEASGAGLATATTKVTLAEGGAEAVVLTLREEAHAAVPAEPVPSPVAVTPPPAVPGPPPAPPEQSGWTRLPAYLVGGVGAAGVVAGAVFGVVTLSQKSSIASACHGTVCPESEKSALDSARTDGNIATAAFIVGGAGLVAGGLLFFLRAPTPSSTATFLRPYLTGTGGGVYGAF